MNPCQTTPVKKDNQDATTNPDTLDSERSNPDGEVVACSEQTERVVADDWRSPCINIHAAPVTDNVADIPCCEADESRTVTSDRGNYVF